MQIDSVQNKSTKTRFRNRVHIIDNVMQRGGKRERKWERE